jgi:hypothetical protein
MKNFRTITMLAFLAATALLGCSKKDSVAAEPSEIDSSSSTNTCSSPTSTPIWKGERSTATTVGVRGAWSDIKMIPTTTYPGTAYIDIGCLCIKYSYWDGGKWTTEVIAATNAAASTFIRIAYLSTGVPIVLWSNGASILQMAIRNTASLTTEGTWTITNLDTLGAAIRAVEIKVNPNDQVAILYARNSGATSHLILCTTGCETGSNYSSPSTSLGTTGAAANTFGLGWCKASSGFFPVVAISGAANSTYAVCRQSTLSSCLNGIASWSGGAMHTLTSSGAARVTLQLAIDDSTVDAPIQAVLNNGSFISYYQSSFAGGGCASGTLAAIAQGGAIPATGATSGNAYLELERSGSTYHLVANEGTASVRYYNANANNFTAWNPSGTVSTLTLAAAGSTRGGLAVDATLGQAYTTFARTAAATPYAGNLMFGLIENIKTASDSVSAEFYETPLTLDGQIQMNASQIPNLAAASTSTGTPATAFVDYSSGSATAGVLRYGLRNGTSSSSSWLVSNVPVVGQPQAVALAFDKNDKPWLGVYDLQSLRFLLLTNSKTDGTGLWSTYYFPLRAAVTAATAPAYNSVALAMDSSATAVMPVMIVGVANHGTLATTGVWAAKLDPSTGDWPSISQINSTNLANSVSNVTADYDSSGNIVVAYYDRSSQNRVEYSQSSNGGFTWTTATQVSPITGAGMGAKIKLNPANGRPAITYYDRSNNLLYYSYCTTALAACGTLVSWSYTFLENGAGISVLAATSEGLLSTGLTFTSAGEAFVAYPIGSGNTGRLALTQTTSGLFGISSILMEGRNANSIINGAMAAINFAQPGWNIDSVRTVTGAMHSIHVGPGNWIYQTSCGD